MRMCCRRFQIHTNRPVEWWWKPEFRRWRRMRRRRRAMNRAAVDGGDEAVRVSTPVRTRLQRKDSMEFWLNENENLRFLLDLVIENPPKLALKVPFSLRTACRMIIPSNRSIRSKTFLNFRIGKGTEKNRLVGAPPVFFIFKFFVIIV
ncbi:hypothetical protein GBA52_013930 [Prunus armeniaca]|nr:hypothetical protein GBA52_013930 [Prunus armeniaca]